ncbi:hypothetical protein OC846_004279 [Tilletia horrida]|uniref:Cytochrome P450 n=1 Tax=Tilletia horrida TaxID=155126 RepID=A0AAN6GMW7_9BASI|nr:hypothetical protein OC846_004279 [Tilletia horrida]KAK0565773.1 hypothetical protein OC861_003594 [Tilletia horrida]
MERTQWSNTTLEMPEMITAFKVLALVAVAFVVLRPILRFVTRPYTAVSKTLKVAPIRNFFWGSWPRRAEVGGEFIVYLHKTIEEYGPVCGLTLFGRRPAIVLGDHRAMSKILLQTPYDRVPMINKIIARHAGAGLLTMEGQDHRRQRKVAFPSFTAPAIQNMTPIFHEKAEILMARLRQQVASDTSAETQAHGFKLNMAKEFFSFALDVIGLAGFDYEFNSLAGLETSALERAFSECLHLLATGTIYSALRVLLNEPIEWIGRTLGVKEQLELDSHKKLVDDISAQLVKRAKSEDGSEKKDLLTLMVRANTSEDLKESQRLSDEELAQMVPVFLFAGHETTATALSWAMLALSDRAKGLAVQQKLRKELAANPSWRDNPVDLDAFPVRALPRRAPYDDVIPLSKPYQRRDGSWSTELHVKKGTQIVIPIMYLNRDESFWGPDGNVFKAERWLPDGHEFKEPSDDFMDPSVKELRGVWSNLASFGAGPQQCIGVRMAVGEFKVAIAHLVNNFEVLPPNLPNEPPVDIIGIAELVVHPKIEGRRHEGTAMPIRLKALS